MSVTDLLIKSDPDTIHLSLAVNERFLDLCDAYKRIRGNQLTPPKSVLDDMKRWRTMVVRHKRKDYRNSRSELQALRAVAQWTCDVNCDIRNQRRKKLVWKD